MLHFGEYRLDTANECLWQGSERHTLTPRPFSVLRYLVGNPGRLVTHDELLEALWPDTYVQPQVLRTYVLELRKLLGDDPDLPRFIQTVPKRGYRFLAEVHDARPEDSRAKSSAQPPPQSGAAFFGRDAELAALQQRLARAQMGSGSPFF